MKFTNRLMMKIDKIQQLHIHKFESALANYPLNIALSATIRAEPGQFWAPATRPILALKAMLIGCSL